MQTRKLNKKNVHYYVLFIVVALALLLAIPLLRLAQENPYVPGEETYEHLSTIQQSSDLSTFTFFDYLISKLATIFSYKTITFFLGLFLGLASLTIFLIYVRRYTKHSFEDFIAGAFLLLAPGFLIAHIGIKVYALLLLLSLLTLYFYTRKNNLFYFFLGLITLLDFTVGILGFALLLIKEILGKQYKKMILSTGTLLITLAIGVLLPFRFVNFSWSNFNLNFNELFFFFGGTYGYSLFLFIVALVGIYLYAQVKISTPVKVIFTLSLVLSLFYEPLRIILLIPLALYGAQSFRYLLNDRWQVHYLHNLTIILLICILLFATTAVVTENVAAAPTTQQVKGFSFLNDLKNSNKFLENSTVLTEQAFSSHISYFAQLQAYNTPTKIQNQQTAQNIFTSRDSRYIEETMQEESIAFIVVDQSMLDGGVWQRPDEGLLFVMNYNEAFKKIYRQDSITIYYYDNWRGE